MREPAQLLLVTGNMSESLAQPQHLLLVITAAADIQRAAQTADYTCTL